MNSNSGSPPRLIHPARHLRLPLAPHRQDLAHRAAPRLRRVRLRDPQRAVARHLHGPNAAGRPAGRDALRVRRRLAHLPLHLLRGAHQQARG